MLVLLSPAKKLDLEPAPSQVPVSEPRLQSQTRDLAEIAKAQSADDLKRLMHISDNLAQLNAERFAAFNLDGMSNSAKQAALSFDGNVYEGLDAGSFDYDDWEFAQGHVRILSGLYGLLRPLDAIQPYRLEMGTKLVNPKGANLYAFWKDDITRSLNADMAVETDKAFLNLASNEYVKAVDKKALIGPMVTAKFLNEKDGKARNLMYYAKFGRGLMARWVVQNRVDRADGLKDFNLEGYRFDTAGSTDSELVFTRPQPAPKQPARQKRASKKSAPKN